MSENTKSEFTLTPEILNLLKTCDPEIKTENLNFNSLDDVWEYLKKEELEVDAKLECCKSKETDLQKNMEQLHKYNYIKDITQEVLGHLANRLNISVIEIHRKFDLENL